MAKIVSPHESDKGSKGGDTGSAGGKMPSPAYGAQSKGEKNGHKCGK